MSERIKRVTVHLMLWVAIGSTCMFRVHSSIEDSTTILEIFARRAFDWQNSTTPAPLSLTASLTKVVLAGRANETPGLADTAVSRCDRAGEILDVRVASVRDFVSRRILEDVKNLCDSARGCDPNEVDPEFGITPLHVAQFWGASDLVDYLTSLGASHDILDNVGRQPRNMTFPTFSKFSKMVGRRKLQPDADAHDRCEIPEVVIPLRPSHALHASSTREDDVQIEEWRQATEKALSEVRRLTSEGEPVMVRNVLPWLLSTMNQGQDDRPASLKYTNASSFVQAWAHRHVDVGHLPYARNFNLVSEHMTLGDFFAETKWAQPTAPQGECILEGRVPVPEETYRQPPRYVFQVDPEACVEGKELFEEVISAALPSSGDKPLICPPATGLLGLESVHYYLGGKGTGAPHHVHSDALNLIITGRKKWWVLTPRHAVWSRRHILEYAEHGEGGAWRDSGEAGEEELRDTLDDDLHPMECVQGAGDLVYVPADWGHAALNLEDGTFG